MYSVKPLIDCVKEKKNYLSIYKHTSNDLIVGKRFLLLFLWRGWGRIINELNITKKGNQ